MPILGAVPMDNLPFSSARSALLSLLGVSSKVHSSSSGATHGGSGGSFKGNTVADLLDGTYTDSGAPSSGVPWDILTSDRHGGSSAAALDYLSADLAKHYKMDASTAYQEALSNTGYQRAVRDMQAAGLNPASLFGSGHGSSADGVAYISSASSGGSGYSRRYGSSAKSKTFGSSAYSAIVNLAGLAGLGLTKKYSGYLGGTTAAKGILSFIDALSR